jgi:ParB family chromosome partitioning protein
MAFKDIPPRFELVDVSRIDPDPNHVRQNINEDALKGLVNAVQKLGLIHPIVVRPGSGDRYVVLAGERRRLAAIQAGETQVPVLIRECSDDEALEVRVFENIGLGVRSALEPRDMANAIQAISERFESPEEAAQYFGRAPTWLAQATAAANLSEKVTALLDSGKISSTSAAVQLEKLAKKNEAKAESLIEQIEQLPEGEKVSKKVVDEVLSEASGRAKKVEETVAAPASESAMPVAEPAAALSAEAAPPWEEAPAPTAVASLAVTSAKSAPRAKVDPSKVRLVAELLGLSDEDEEAVLAQLIDEFLALKQG